MESIKILGGSLSPAPAKYHDGNCFENELKIEPGRHIIDVI
jgi:hypothetical protein